jgi:hypothetical protein
MTRNKKYVVTTLFFAFLLAFVSVLASYILVKTHKNVNYQAFFTALFEVKKEIKNENYDVLFLGDSSLLRGLNTKKFESLSNKKAFNMALSATSGPISYKLLLKEYLKNNSKPECIVIYFSPSAPFYYKINSFEKVYLILKYGDFETIRGEVNVPNVIMTGSTLLYLYASRYLGMSHFSFNEFKNIIIENKGYLINSGKPLKENFEVNSISNQTFHFDYLLDLKKSCESFGIKTVLYVAPTIYNENGYEYFKEQYKDKVINQLTRVPNKYFTDYTHMTFDGAYENTIRVWNDLKRNEIIFSEK